MPDVKSGKIKMTAQAAEEFKKKVEDAEFAYDDLIQKIAQATENEGRKLPPGARNSATKAYDHAKKLRYWIWDLMVDSDPSWASLKREDKLLSMPYLIALAYAVRMMVDARMVMNHEIEDEVSRKLKSLDCSRIMNEFLGVARSAIMALVCNLSLLEVAEDYYLPLAAYMKLSIGIKASDPIMPRPEMIAAAREQGWSDGLSDIRWGGKKRDDDDDNEESQGHIAIHHSHIRAGPCSLEAPTASPPSSSKAPERAFGLLNSPATTFLTMTPAS